MGSLEIHGYKELFVLHLMFTYIGGQIEEFSWVNTGPGKRFVKASSVLSTSDHLLPLQCGRACSKNPECFSFNYRAESGTCELLNTAHMITGVSHETSETGWNIYTYVSPPKCPTGSVPLPYDFLNNLRKETEEGYACTTNSLILNELQQGKTGCRLVLRDREEFNGSDAPNYAGKPGSYFEALRHCYINTCAGVVCQPSQDVCWLKISTSEATGNPIISHNDRRYWKPECS